MINRKMLVGVAAAMALAASARAETPSVAVKFAEGRLTVSATDAPLEDVVREVARVVGADVKGAVQAPRRLTLALEDEPLEDALRRILGEQPFSLRYQADRLREIELVDVGSPVRRAPAGAPGIPLPDGDRYFPPPQARVLHDPTGEQLEAAKAEYEAVQRPFEPPAEETRPGE